MKKPIFVFLLLLFCGSVANAKPKQLSLSAKVSLITCDPATDIYARFGHSAIRICDTANNIDIAYNYGIFDFNSGFFIPKFVKGATDYMLEVFDTESFIELYSLRKSSVYEQILSLSQEQKQSIFEALEINALPQNKIYRYNFVYDNCATRPYNLIIGHLDSTPVIEFSHNRVITYRSVFEEFVGRDNWQSFGINIVIGSDADLPISPAALIAFPKYTMQAIASIYHKNDSVDIPLVETTRKLCDFPLIVPDEHFVLRPSIVCSLILILVAIISIFSLKRNIYYVWLDFLIFLATGSIGCVIFYLMFFSVHPLVSNNYNLLWLNPLHLIFAILVLWKNNRVWLGYVALIFMIMALVALIILFARIQMINAAAIPIIATIILRAGLMFSFQKKTKLLNKANFSEAKK